MGYKLTKEIIERSESNIWDEAKLEWDLEHIYRADEAEACLCGHFPIIEICIIKNQRNESIAQVGNCCVKKFLGLPSDKLFQSMKKLHQDIEKSCNSETIEIAYDKKWINGWEKDFYKDIWRKRNLSPKQLEIKIRINQKILPHFDYQQ